MKAKSYQNVKFLEECKELVNVYGNASLDVCTVRKEVSRVNGNNPGE